MRHFEVGNNTKIYIVCPGNMQSGGPELLHQLAFELRKNNIAAFMFYINCKTENPVAEVYKKYNVPYVLDIKKEEDNKNNIIITPETCTQWLYKFKNLQKSIYWLSVNYARRTQGKYLFVRLLKRAAKVVLHKQNFDFGLDKNSIIHICQSYYAVDHLQKHNCKKIIYISDYINEIYTQNVFSVNNRKDVVLYNPKKGKEFTAELIRQGTIRGMVFKPLINMTYNEVLETLNSSKVYIDFGEHPGKDRFPREAAMCGCCIITGLKGAASFEKDVPIDKSYKFEESQVNEILDAITQCLNNYENEILKFDSYRELILNERKMFEVDVRKAFV